MTGFDPRNELGPGSACVHCLEGPASTHAFRVNDAWVRHRFPRLETEARVDMMEKQREQLPVRADHDLPPTVLLGETIDGRKRSPLRFASGLATGERKVEVRPRLLDDLDEIRDRLVREPALAQIGTDLDRNADRRGERLHGVDRPPVRAGVDAFDALAPQCVDEKAGLLYPATAQRPFGLRRAEVRQALGMADEDDLRAAHGSRMHPGAAPK